MTNKPRNATATDPRLKKGHAHKSAKDYDRKAQKKQLKDALSDRVPKEKR